MLRITLRSLLSRKLRLMLSTTAIVLGVMFVSGALILTDTLGRSFDNLFTGAFAYTDVAVTKPAQTRTLTGQPAPTTVPAADIARIRDVPGVASATGQVFVDGARVIGPNGKVVTTQGSPRYGANWAGDTELVSLRSGRGPTADNEIVISANLATTTGYTLGDTVTVITTDGKPRPFTLVGIAGYASGRDSLAGETTVAFTETTAQQLMLRDTGVYSMIEVRVTGATPTEVRDRIAAALGPDYDVKTGEQLADDSSESIKEGLRFFNYILLGFAAVALFVGIFLIVNTFSIIVAQRTRELALLRAMGASRHQVTTSVLIEATVVGVIASIIGLAAGLGAGIGLSTVMGSQLSDGTLELAGFALPWTAIVAALGVGIAVPLIAATLPALRASRIPPVAAMREAATPDRPLTTQTITGAAITAAGGTALGLGLTGNLGSANLWGVLGGLLAAFVGVALLTPVLSRPVIAVLGRLVGFTPAGDLGRRNSQRNPRRTAITAAALMVSIALVTGISVVFESIRASTLDAVSTGINAELVIASEAISGGTAAIDPDAIKQISALPTVNTVVSFSMDLAKFNGQDNIAVTANNTDAAAAMFELTATAGTLTPLTAGHLLVDSDTATAAGLTVGDTVTVTLARAANRPYTVTGVYKRTQFISGFLLPSADADAFTSPAPNQAYIAVTPGADDNAVRKEIEPILANSPEVTVARLDDFIADQVKVFDIILIFVQLLLGLAMIIAVLGIINTLALSMTERTRELGLLRAIGLNRRQLMWMVTVESVVISVFGALLGVAVGVGLGTSVVGALHDEGFTTLALPWTLMGGYIAASVIVGLIAAGLPAIRAARLDVLKAIAYE